MINVDHSQSRLVSLPTKGVYAETLLSHCNATEIRDLDRVIDEKNACRTEAPDIEGVSPGSRRSEVDTQPMGPPQSSVNIQQAPDAPDPTGLQGALNTLSQPDIFRDMSLGSETVNAANSLAQKALDESGQARKQTLEALSSILEAADGDGSSGDSSGDSSSSDSGSGTSGSSAGGADAKRAAFDAAQDKIQNAANEAHRRSDPVAQRDHQRGLDKAKAEGSLSEDAHSRASERLNNADEQASAGNEQGSQATPSAESTSEQLDEHTYKIRMLLEGFPVEGTELADEHIRALEYLVATKNAGMQVLIEKIEGRASQTGPDDLNEQLSRERGERVAQYLIRNGFSPDMEVVHYGDDNPLVNRPGEELAVNRSVVVTYLAWDPLPEPKQPDPQEPTNNGRCPGGTERKWEIMLPAAMNAHAILGGAIVAGKLRKANNPSEERNIFFIGAGAGVSLSSKLDEADDVWKILRELRDKFGGSIGGDTWGEFTTGNTCYDFDAFDNAYGRITMGEAGLGIGVETAFVTWPMLEGASINLRGLNWGPIGAEASTNAGIWIVEDLDDA